MVQQVLVPDVGEAEEVEVIEILVKIGDGRVRESVLQRIARELEIPHRYVDLTLDEYRELRLPSVRDEDLSPEELRKKTEARESRIFESVVADHRAWEERPAILIVGASHLEGIRSRLKDLGYEVTEHDRTAG